MARRLLPLLALLGALLVPIGAWWVMFARGTPQASIAVLDRSSPGASTAETDEEPVPMAPLEVARSSPADLLDAESGVGLGAVTGRAVDRAGRVLERVAVRLSWSGNAKPVEAPEVQTGANGTFTLERVAAIPGASIALIHPDHATLRLEVNVQPGEVLDLGDLVLGSGAMVAGFVVSSSGRSVARATVITREREVESDWQGAFVIDGLAEGEYWLWARSDGFASLPTPPVRLHEGELVKGVEVVLDPAEPLSGFVRGPDGAVSGARVSARQLALKSLAEVPFGRGWVYPDRHETVTGEDGFFQLHALPPGMVEVEVRHPAHLHYEKSHRTGSLPLDILLKSAGRVFGEVVADSGELLPLHRLTLLKGNGGARRWRRDREVNDVEAELLREGRFAFATPPGKDWWRIVAEGPDFAAAVSAPFRVSNGKSVGPLVLEAETGWSLRGSVADETGRPVAGARVWARENRGPEHLVQEGGGYGFLPVRSAPDGTFTTHTVPAGTYTVIADRSGFLYGAVEDVEVLAEREPDRLRIVMDRAGSLRGRVTGTEGASLPALEVVAIPAPDSPDGITQEGVAKGRSETVDAAGFFEFTRLLPGQYSVQLRSKYSPPPAAEESILVDLRAGEEKWIELPLVVPGRGSVTGRLFLNGVPAPLRRVELARDPGGRAQRSSTTDMDGRFLFSSAQTGRRFLLVEALHGLRAPGVETEILEGRLVEQDLHIATGVLAGRVQSADTHKPLAGARITLGPSSAPLRSRGLVSVTTDKRGAFRLDPAPAGPLLLSASRNGYATIRRSVDVPAGTRASPEVLEMRRVASVEVVVEGSRSRGRGRGRGGEEIEVVARPVSSGSPTLRKSRSSRIVVELPEPGTYDITVRKPSTGQTRTVQRDVELGRRQSVRIRLE